MFKFPDHTKLDTHTHKHTYLAGHPWTNY